MEDGLLRAEKKLQASGQRLSSIGQDIALSIGLPLAAIGVSAVKAAGDIESLTLALEGQLGSAEKAREELELLRKAALAPGLGFEQAVRGSVQLQAVGLSAEEARRTIEAFGNGLALAGKGGAELDGVITAIGQISSKGKVFAEEINQIAERLPQIRTLMKQAFGTSNTEDIQKLGLSSQEFTAAIVEQLEKLPKATGGIKNAFDNMRDSVNQSLATVGFAINDAFDVTGTLASFSNVISSLANSFAELNPTVRAVVLSVGSLLIALGPLVKIFGILQAVKATYVIALEEVKKGLLAISGAALNAAKAFGALKTAQQATIIGAAIAVITALAFAYKEYASRVSESAEATKAFNENQKNAVSENDRATYSIRQLAKAAQNEALSEEERIKALNELKRISPEYFGNLDIEKGKIVGLDGAVKNYVESMLKAAKTRAALADIEKNAATINELQKKRNELEKDLQRTREAAVKSENQLQTLGSSGATLGAQARAQATEESVNKVLTEIFALEELNKEIESGIKITDIITESKNNYVKTSTKTQAEINKEAAAIEKANKTLIEQSRLLNQNFEPIQQRGGIVPAENISNAGTDLVVTPEVSLGAQLEALTAFNELLAATGTNVTTFATGYAAAIEGINENTIGFGEAFDQVAATIAESGTAVQKVTVAVLDSFARLASDGSASFADYANAALEAGKKVIGILIKEGVAAAVTRALTSSGFAALNPFAALALAGAAGIGAQGIFTSLLNKIKIPALAEGGITTKPTLAMVGDNPGGREAIIPLNKLPGLMQQSSDGMGTIVAEYILRGQDLLTVLKRAETSNQRLTGAF